MSSHVQEVEDEFAAFLREAQEREDGTSSHGRWADEAQPIASGSRDGSNPPRDDLSMSGSSQPSSETDSCRSLSPAPSRYSYAASRDQLRRELFGRQFNDTNHTYMLPADDEEYRRMDMLHNQFLLLFRGHHFHPPAWLIDFILRRDPDGPRKKILDLGSGGGIWCLQVAELYPWVEILGVDLAPSLSRPRPNNCSWEVDDVNMGLHHYQGSYDVIQSRLIAWGIHDFPTHLQNVVDCLKPGGVASFIEGVLEVCDEHGARIPPAFDNNPTGSHFGRLLHEVSECMARRGGSVKAAYFLGDWLPQLRGIQHSSVDYIIVPCGTYGNVSHPSDAQRMYLLGHTMLQQCLAHAESFRPFLLDEGYDPRWVSRIIHNARAEIYLQRNDGAIRVHAKWACGWVRKAGGPTPPMPYFVPPGMFYTPIPPIMSSSSSTPASGPAPAQQ